MDTKRLVVWLARHSYLGLGLAMVGADVATIAGWVSNSGIGAPVALGLLTFFTPLAVLGFGAWVLNHPWRPSVRFKALYDEIAACRDSIGLDAPTVESVLDTVPRMAVLQQKMKRLGIEWSAGDIYDRSVRNACLADLTVLAAYAAVGNIKAARLTQDVGSET